MKAFREMPSPFNSKDQVSYVKGAKKMKINIKKIVVGGMLVAVAVSLSSFSIPIGASKCFPIQHMVNVIAAVFLRCV